MFTRNGLPRNDRLSEPITVHVRDVSQTSNPKLDFQVVVEDVDGHTLPLKIWSTHSLSVSFTEGHRYILENVRGRYWMSDGTRQYQLSSTRDLTVTGLGPADDTATRLLVVGDTHVGYRHRRNKDKVAGVQNLDARNRFRAVMNQANSLGADAVIHAGDIFDHVAIGADRSFVLDCLESELDVPFYYIYGNHDAQASRLTVDGATADVQAIERLSNEGTTVGDDDATLFGIDYSAAEFPGPPLEQSTHAVRSNANVSVVHDTPYPVRDEDGSRMHQMQGADFRKAIKRTTVDIDLIVCGHMHVGQVGTLNEFQIPVVVTGAPAPINRGKRNNNPSTWLVQVTRDGIDDITRHPV